MKTKKVKPAHGNRTQPTHPGPQAKRSGGVKGPRGYTTQRGLRDKSYGQNS